MLRVCSPLFFPLFFPLFRQNFLAITDEDGDNSSDGGGMAFDGTRYLLKEKKEKKKTSDVNNMWKRDCMTYNGTR